MNEGQNRPPSVKKTKKKKNSLLLEILSCYKVARHELLGLIALFHEFLLGHFFSL